MCSRPFPVRSVKPALALGRNEVGDDARCTGECLRLESQGAVILGLGRAIGETMAVTMVIGNRAHISASLFESSYTIASVIANEFTEATQDLYLSALVELGLILFLVTFVVNAIARFLVWNVTRKTSGVGSAADFWSAVTCHRFKRSRPVRDRVKADSNSRAGRQVAQKTKRRQVAALQKHAQS
jgi:hypothetical protein